LIAVQNCADPQIGRLNEPLQNAQKLRFVLTARYRFANRDVKLLRDPKRDDLVEALDVRIDLKWWRDAGASSRGLLACLALPATRKGEVTRWLKDAAAAKSANPVVGYRAVDPLICLDESLWTAR
jgi:hypothetical protein